VSGSSAVGGAGAGVDTAVALVSLPADALACDVVAAGHLDEGSGSGVLRVHVRVVSSAAGVLITGFTVIPSWSQVRRALGTRRVLVLLWRHLAVCLCIS
jgi:hypothetical protein